MALYRQLNPDDPALTGAKARTIFAAISRSDYLYLFVLTDDAGVVQATCYLNLFPNLTRGARPYGIIENVVTEERLRGRGLGQRDYRPCPRPRLAGRLLQGDAANRLPPALDPRLLQSLRFQRRREVRICRPATGIIAATTI